MSCARPPTRATFAVYLQELLAVRCPTRPHVLTTPVFVSLPRNTDDAHPRRGWQRRGGWSSRHERFHYGSRHSRGCRGHRGRGPSGGGGRRRNRRCSADPCRRRSARGDRKREEELRERAGYSPSHRGVQPRPSPRPSPSQVSAQPLGPAPRQRIQHDTRPPHPSRDQITAPNGPLRTEIRERFAAKLAL